MKLPENSTVFGLSSAFIAIDISERLGYNILNAMSKDVSNACFKAFELLHGEKT